MEKLELKNLVGNIREYLHNPDIGKVMQDRIQKAAIFCLV
jgi:hypothetical protein